MEQKHILTSDQKLKAWGYGEWVEEPDEVHFQHNAIACKILRVAHPEDASGELLFGGHLCGYVKIPENHPWYNDDTNPWMELEIHGGITYNGDEPDGRWIGFDCAHSHDTVPSTQSMMGKIRQDLLDRFPQLENLPIFDHSYKNISYVWGECISLAEQVIASSMPITNEKKCR